MSATHLAHVRRLTTHDTVTGATIKALFFCIEKHFQRRSTHALPVLSNFLSFFLYPISRIQQYGMTPASVVLSITWRARRGLFLFLRSRCALYTYCGASLHLTIWRASRRVSDEQQHTAKTFPLSRSDARTIEEKHRRKFCWGWAPADCRHLRGVWARRAQYRYPPALREEDGLSGVCIYICLSTCTRQLLLMYYMHVKHIKFLPG